MSDARGVAVRRPRRAGAGDRPPSPKKLKLDEALTPDVLRAKVKYAHEAELGQLDLDYTETMYELFFLQTMGNLIDYPSWRKNPPKDSVEFVKSCRQEDLKIAEKQLTGDAAAGDLKTDSAAGEEPVDVVKVSDDPEPLLSFKHEAGSRDSSGMTVGDTIAPSQEAIVERAKQEAQVLARVSELRKNGLWSARRLPKVQEPPRAKAHWDYLLEEMQWLAADFAQERKWKKAGARKIAGMINKYHKEKHMSQQKAEKEEGQKIKRVASNISKMVKEFWSNIEKVVEFKQQSRLEEKRKQAMDIHLSFIVDQTEKYSTWLTAGLENTSSPGPSSIDDGEFEPGSASSDDEETIAQEEDEAEDDVGAEIQDLQNDMELPIEQLIGSLPPEILKGPATPPPTPPGSQEQERRGQKRKRSSSSSSEEDFGSDAEQSDDDEATLDQEEAEEMEEEEQDNEMDDLMQEGEMSIDELRARYAGAYSQDFESTLPEEEVDDVSSSDDEEEEEEEEKEEAGDLEDVGMEYLMKDLDQAEPRRSGSASPGTDISDIAAAAQSIQPTGYTLETTQVNTPIPHLLRGTLREYQVVGLNWLATMYQRKLNGILADEMGLGKTIQTIALLAHLACEKNIWGPHLIVVPTSVMLNWELELKRWCPGFKILTYFGTLKERKAKRQGWTKTNAFHICITSYKLVIQDHQSFRRKKWKYLVLDEAQNIKNFKSQRWQTLLNFQAQRRLLLTGTPLQNSLMELWSLMHFLMPHIFQSHSQFKEWFANPLTGMIEGAQEYNENLVHRLHKVLRPFLLRRLKADVEKQMPQKYEHIVPCQLSRRQRYLYEDFMAQRQTKDTLASGHYMSVINILMQLRKVCNHPNLFDPRPVASPLTMDGIMFHTPSLVLRALEKEKVSYLTSGLASLDSCLSSLVSKRTRELQPPSSLIVEIDSSPPSPARPQVLRKPLKLMKPPSPLSQIGTSGVSTLTASTATQRPQIPMTTPSVEATPLNQLPGHPSRSQSSSSSSVSSPAGSGGQAVQVSSTGGPSTTQPITVQIQHTTQGTKLMIPSGQLCQLPGYIQIVQTSDGQQIIATCQPPAASSTTVAATTSAGTRLVSTVSASKGPHPTSAPQPPTRRSVSAAAAAAQANTSKYQQDWLDQLRSTSRRQRLETMASINSRRCALNPLYGTDVHAFLRKMLSGPCTSYATPPTVPGRLAELQPLLDRYVFTIPSAKAPVIRQRVFHPPPSFISSDQNLSHGITSQVLPAVSPALGRLMHQQMVQFPEVRLIQYDCGKLQVLDLLLRRLKTEHHRVLLFTQMTRMLDVLEQFLNYHGHRYLRLDGATKIEQRQALMDRFNADKRIFVFILSTRSGGLGVNLTGADTVIFYDSDWNPTMDAQAQDRCHRIGQTRDVHIYRLISEKTIEENILKKANQKRLLSEVTIEGGNFTTAYLRERTLQELFDEPSSLEDIVAEAQRERQAVQDARKAAQLSQDEMEQALAAAEDEDDRQAGQDLKVEQAAQVEEFDENIPWDEREAAERENQMSRVEMQLALIDKELSPIERFALTFLESSQAQLSAQELQLAESEVNMAKENWELNRLKALKEEEELRAELEEDEMFLTYGRTDAYNKVKVQVPQGLMEKETTKLYMDSSSEDEGVEEVGFKIRAASRGETDSNGEIDVVTVSESAGPAARGPKRGPGPGRKRKRPVDLVNHQQTISDSEAVSPILNHKEVKKTPKSASPKKKTAAIISPANGGKIKRGPGRPPRNPMIRPPRPVKPTEVKSPVPVTKACATNVSLVRTSGPALGQSLARNTQPILEKLAMQLRQPPPPAPQPRAVVRAPQAQGIFTSGKLQMRPHQSVPMQTFTPGQIIHLKSPSGLSQMLQIKPQANSEQRSLIGAPVNFGNAVISSLTSNSSTSLLTGIVQNSNVQLSGRSLQQVSSVGGQNQQLFVNVQRNGPSVQGNVLYGSVIGSNPARLQTNVAAAQTRTSGTTWRIASGNAAGQRAIVINPGLIQDARNQHGNQLNLQNPRGVIVSPTCSPGKSSVAASQMQSIVLKSGSPRASNSLLLNSKTQPSLGLNSSLTRPSNSILLNAGTQNSNTVLLNAAAVASNQRGSAAGIVLNSGTQQSQNSILINPGGGQSSQRFLLARAAGSSVQGVVLNAGGQQLVQNAQGLVMNSSLQGGASGGQGGTLNQQIMLSPDGSPTNLVIRPQASTLPPNSTAILLRSNPRNTFILQSPQGPRSIILVPPASPQKASRPPNPS